MKALVLIKKTPDTETKIRVSDDHRKIDDSSTKYIMNPYDEYAIEQSLLLKEQGKLSEVVLVSVGDASTKDIIVKGLAMGADRGILIEGAPEGSFAVASALAKIAEIEKPLLVWAGRHAIDDNNMHIPLMMAELLGWPHVNIVSKFNFDSDKAIVERAVDGGEIEVYEVELPAVFGADKSLNQPRFASLPNIMKAKKKPIDSKTWSDLKTDTYGLPVDLVPNSFAYPPEKKPGQKIAGGSMSELADQLIQKLREEAKVL